MPRSGRKQKRQVAPANAPKVGENNSSTSPQGRRVWWIAAALGAAAIAGGVIFGVSKLRSPDPAQALSTSMAAAPQLGSAPTPAPLPPVEIPPARPGHTKAVATTGPDAGYIGGTASCAECHASIVESYSKVAMGRSLYPATPDKMTAEDFSTTGSEYYHEASRQFFRMVQEGEKYFQERWQLGPRGEKINVLRTSVEYVCGSGNHARSYIHVGSRGEAYQLPLAWYPQPSKWAMNPGYDHAQHSGFSRRITYDCAFCHAALPKIPAGNDRSNYADTSLFPHGLEAIDCERCHGPAAKHVELAKANAPAEQVHASIVNPGKLDPKLQLDTCLQCHLETTSGKLPHATFAEGQPVFAFRPGEPMEKFRIHFDHPQGAGHDDKFEIAGQGYRMRMSKCFTESQGRMTCTTCHDPHRVPRDRIAAGIASCMECHTDTSCKEQPHVREMAKNNCIECHMPQRRTDDVVNVVMTDHFIQRRKPESDLTAPKKEDPRPYQGEVKLYYPEEMEEDKKNLYLGIAHVADGADIPKGVQLLSTYLEKFPDSVLARMTREFGYKELGEMDKAVSDLLKAIELQGDRPQAYMALGDALERRGQHADAVRAYEEAIKLDANLFVAWNGLGVNRLLQGDVDGAIEAYKRASEIEPFDEDAHLNLTSAYGRQGRIVEAAAHARKALTINPSKGTGWVLLAQCLLAEKTTTGPEEAAWYAAEGMRLDAGRPEPFDTLRDAVDAMAPEKQLAALQRFEKDILFEAQALRARVLVRREDPEEAEETLEALAPRVEGTSYSLVLDTAGEAAAAVRRHDLAEVFYARSLELEGQNEAALTGLATALAIGSAAGEAKAAQLLMNNPLAQNIRVLNALAFLRATARTDSLRNGAEAEALARNAAAQLATPNVFTLDTLAAAQAEQGKFTEAVATIEQAASMARRDNLPHLVEMLESRLPLYRAAKPLRAGQAPLE